MGLAYRASLVREFQARLLAILTAAAIIACLGVPAIASTNASVNYVATPPAPCPQTITFVGQVSTTDWAVFSTNHAAQYQWYSDDTTNLAKQYVSFPTNATSENVYWTRTFATSHTGWVSLQVWSPGITRSQNFPIQIVCSVGVQPSAEDCVNYNATNLTDVNKSGTWYVMDGTTSLQQFGSEADALAGLAVARAHHQQCFVGRGKALQYLMEYWK
jgi:hypothetical protein